MKFKFLFLVATVGLSSLAVHAGGVKFVPPYACKVVVGKSPDVKELMITNFEVTNLGAIAGDVIVDEYRYSIYQYQRQLRMDIALVQSGNEITPFLSVATAESIIPASGFEEATVRLNPKGYIICEAR